MEKIFLDTIYTLKKLENNFQINGDYKLEDYKLFLISFDKILLSCLKFNNAFSMKDTIENINAYIANGNTMINKTLQEENKTININNYEKMNFSFFNNNFYNFTNKTGFVSSGKDDKKNHMMLHDPIIWSWRKIKLVELFLKKYENTSDKLSILKDAYNIAYKDAHNLGIKNYCLSSFYMLYNKQINLPNKSILIEYINLSEKLLDNIKRILLSIYLNKYCYI